MGIAGIRSPTIKYMANKFFIIQKDPIIFIDMDTLLLVQAEWKCSNWQEKADFSIASEREFNASDIQNFLKQVAFVPDLIQDLGGLMQKNGANIFHEGFLNYLQRVKIQVAINVTSDKNNFIYFFEITKIQKLLVEKSLRKMLSK